MRSSSRYLAALASVRDDARPTSIVAVAGGLAFLHAISSRTRSLVIVDRDADTLSHWSLVCSLLREATSLGDFLTLLTGRNVTGTFADGTATLGLPEDVAPRLARTLTAADLALYMRTYGALSVDDEGVGHHPRFTVRFFGVDLRLMHFNWQFGEGNLKDETTFHVLRTRLAQLPIRIEHRRLEQLDYGTAFEDEPDGSRVLLASNCESPMFTSADAIFLRVMESATRPVRYITWHRDVIVSDGTVREVRASKAADLPARSAGTSVLLDGATDAVASSGTYRRTASSIAELRAVPEYGSPRLVVRGYSSDQIRAVLVDIAPAFLEVLWDPVTPTATPGFSLPNYVSCGTVSFEGRPVWCFQLLGAH